MYSRGTHSRRELSLAEDGLRLYISFIIDLLADINKIVRIRSTSTPACTLLA
jgi:hypothetical protein